MFSLIKGIIWLAGFVVVATIALNYFGYEINKEYFKDSRAACEEKMRKCSEEYFSTGGQDASKCKFDCVKPGLIIKKQ